MSQDQLLSSLKKDVRSLLISSKHGLAPEQLRRDYQTMLGHPMPLRLLGFRNVLDMANEMPDVVHLAYALDGSIVLKAIGDETTKGIEDLVSKQRNHKPKPSIKKGFLGTFPSRRPQYHHPFVLPRRGHPPPALPAQLRSQLRQVLSHGAVRLSELEARYMACFGKPLKVTQYGFFSISEMLAAASDLLVVRQTRMGSLLMLRAMRPAVPTSSAMYSKQPARISSPPIKPVLREKAVLSNVEIEVQSPKEFAATSAQNTRPPSPVPQPVEEKQSFEKSVAKLEEQFKQRILENVDAGTVSQELRDKLRQVVAGHSQGIAIYSLPIEYKKMYGEDLPVAQLGFQSVTELVGALSDIFYVKPCPEEGAKHLLIVELNDSDAQQDLSQSEDCLSSLSPSTESCYFSCGKSAWEPEEGEETSDSSASDTEIIVTNKTIHQMVDIFPVMNVSSGSGVPLDALQCQKLKPPTCRKERELVPALVERMESPSLFYVRFDESQEARNLENMMIEMRSCYTCPEVTERYRLPDAYVRPGQVCCVAPRDMWFYRVVIHQVLNATEVQVYYVDFGDLSVVKRNRLCFLKSCYADLPAQAVPSVLAGIKPVKGIWTKEATNAFQKLCCERTLVAAVHSYQKNFLLLFLCDTHTEEDLYIHSLLLAEGHGMACSPASTPILKQFNPITLYLGNDKLEEIEHYRNPLDLANGLSQNDRPQQDPSMFLTDGVKKHLPCKENEDHLDLPELEFICVAQVEKANPFGELLNKESSNFNNWDPEWTDRNSAEDEPKPVQNWQEKSGAAVSLSSAPSVKLTSGAQFRAYVQDCKQAQSASTLRTLSLHTPGLMGSCSRQQTDMSVESFHFPPTSSLAFPVFKTGHSLGPEALFRRHASPLALGPAARLAAGSSLLHWYPHKRA
ncbi:tudor domain-containing protein 5 [Astyanax mexicanus]|uniref:tudor domain-containing protein 5 n=1 Tax=Astyanax mexicanus TaxID=7994 RepID=UPI0020CB007E|nr:tudor domain-containing protein 5 [Astyanax mexicanus]XP_049321829.1 tudor domain-containing protein 5 [Astyanax mexicanus]XP_049321830.1 tudor domain-containing protein 5 [Astyanax mexicanus]